MTIRSASDVLGSVLGASSVSLGALALSLLSACGGSGTDGMDSPEPDPPADGPVDQGDEGDGDQGDGDQGDGDQGDGDQGDGDQGDGDQGDGDQGDGDQGDGDGDGDGTSGEIGDDCWVHTDCDSAYCRVLPGGVEGHCAMNDFGTPCQQNDDCAWEVCIGNWEQDDYGYCTTTCEGFDGCPTFWECTELGNAAGTFCVQPE